MSEAWIVVDLGFGDQGKGTVTDFLVRDRGARTVVRYNGGAQAGHNVVTPDGRHHTFAQFGSGTFVPGVRTFLGAQVVVQPWAMVVEAEHLARAGVPDAFERTRVHEAARVVTPFHRAANRLRERARGEARHGSCGVGIGEAVRDSIECPDLVVRARDLFDRTVLRAKLRRVQEHRRAEFLGAAPCEELGVLEDPDAADFWIERLAPFRASARLAGDAALRAWLAEGPAVFEGAQGVLLDERHGFHPYTTWSDCTATHALAALAGFDGPVVKLGVVRAYATRHGPGPFVTEDAALTARLPDPHNGRHPWQGEFRVGAFDAVATRYAIRACGGIDALAVTCLDRLDDWRVATHYEMDGAVVRDLDADTPTGRLFRARPVYRSATGIEDHVAAVAAETGVPVRLRSRGPTAADKAWALTS
jgi:adenylosuccinate synthase